MTPTNRLAGEGSLYLRQHAENPVDWYPWGDEALARARSEGRPILLSIGYSSCHWCHVMAHESFEDPQIAAVMNEHFVCVKVDREERPDVDALYMQATLAMTGHGGWPMTVFLTPDTRPFYAGTYFPPVARSGMPGFADLCTQLAEVFRSRPDDVERTANELANRLREAAERQGAGDQLGAQAIDDAVVGLARRFDPVHGGFGGAPKFPPHVALEFLLRRLWRRPGDQNALEMVELTLARMADGGIHDQIGGGFHRYAVDGVWLVPHFEKMLYDNALLASAYTLAWRVTGRPRWRQVAERTLDYLLREMRVAGGFASAQDADSPGGEGAYFTWTPQQLAEVLSPEEAGLAAAHWGVTNEGNFEHGWSVLHVARGLDQMTEDVAGARLVLEGARAKLMAARAGRAAPARDDKIVVAWNGLAIAALAEAGLAFGRADYLDAAAEAAEMVLTLGRVDGRLHRTIGDGRARHLGCLDDHAGLAHGLLALYGATFSPAWLVAAREVVQEMRSLFADPDGGGFFMTGSDAPGLLVRPRELEDHPTPAGNSLAAWVMIRLAALTGETALEDDARSALRLVGDEAVRYPQAFGTALVALDAAGRGLRQVAIVGAFDDPATTALIETARGSAGPDAVIAAARPSDAAAVEACPLLAAREPVRGAPAAYVCERFACQAPVTSPESLRGVLTGG